jgi:5-methylthioadenosine/S-adenosylhomocysteine deaminase
MASILIKKGYLLDPALAFEVKDILIEDTLITRIESNIDFQADKVINAQNKVIMPGLISAHTHLFTQKIKGLTDNLLLEPWLLYAFGVTGMPSPRDLYVWNSIGAIELLKTGTTALFEHGPVVNPQNWDEQLDATASAFSDVGIRAVIAPLYSDFLFSDSLPLHLLRGLKPQDIAPLDPHRVAPKADDIILTLRRVITNWQERDSLISLCLGPATLNTCSRELMEETVKIASEFGLGIQTHLAESKTEVLATNRIYAPRSAVEFLTSINCLGPHVSFAHGVWLSEEEIKTLAETKSIVVHSPLSNMKLGSGVAPVQVMKTHGLDVALGCDDPGCNDSANMLEVMKGAALVGKLYGHPSKWVSGPDAFTMCLTGGAKVLRKKTGSLQPGYLADLVILGTETLFVIPKEYFINQLVFSELGSSVETVIVGGRVIIQDKEIKTVNERELHAEANESIQKMYASIDALHKSFTPALELLDRMGIAVAQYKYPFSRLVPIK